MLSVLIPWRSTDPDRIRAWARCRREWEAVEYFNSDIELIIESDGRPAGAPKFSISKAYNRAFSRAHGDVMLTYGANMVPSVMPMHVAYETARKHHWSRVFDEVTHYSLEETRDLLAGVELDDLPKPRHAIVTGVMAISREAWESVGGYDERFDGYGYEDAAMRNLLASHYGVTDDFGGHLHMLNHGQTGGLARVEQENHELFWREYAYLAPELN